MEDQGDVRMAVKMETLPGQPGVITRVPLSGIRPYDRNPRRISDKAVEQVSKSIQEFGWQQPIVVDRDMVIIIGHARRQAAVKLGLAEVPVLIETRLTDDQVRALRIADNRTRDYSQWDYPLLLSELEGLDESFSSVLDLADWQDIITGFESSQEEALLDLDDEIQAAVTDRFVLTVTFDTKENAEQAAPEILALAGVVNVRYTGK